MCRWENHIETNKLSLCTIFFIVSFIFHLVPFLGVYGIRYGTAYKGRINFIIRQAQESGLLDKWERVNTMSEQKTQAKLHSGNGLVPFSLLHLQTAFYVYVVGIVTAIAVFLSEYSLKYFLMKNKNVSCGLFSLSNVPVLLPFKWRGAWFAMEFHWPLKTFGVLWRLPCYQRKVSSCHFRWHPCHLQRWIIIHDLNVVNVIIWRNRKL